MPLTFTITDGVLPKGQEKIAFSKLCETFLRWHGLEGNSVMTPNVVGSIHILPKEHTFSGAEESSVAFIEWKVPSFAFADTKTQQGFFAEATDIVHYLSEGKLSKDKIWINVLHAVDGAWGINGDALTNDQLKTAISNG